MIYYWWWDEPFGDIVIVSITGSWCKAAFVWLTSLKLRLLCALVRILLWAMSRSLRSHDSKSGLSSCWGSRAWRRVASCGGLTYLRGCCLYRRTFKCSHWTPASLKFSVWGVCSVGAPWCPCSWSLGFWTSWTDHILRQYVSEQKLIVVWQATGEARSDFPCEQTWHSFGCGWHWDQQSRRCWPALWPHFSSDRRTGSILSLSWWC